MNIELKPIAQKKLDQMGATVHGVLVKNQAGAWAAVSEAGRVMWLDGFEGQAAQPEPSSGVPEGRIFLDSDDARSFLVSACGPEYSRYIRDSHGLAGDFACHIASLLTAAPTPEAGQSGGVPAGDPLPCPFCGSSDVGGAGGVVSCYRCNARIEVQNTNTPYACLLYTSPSPRDKRQSRMPSSA